MNSPLVGIKNTRELSDILIGTSDTSHHWAKTNGYTEPCGLGQDKRWHVIFFSFKKRSIWAEQFLFLKLPFKQRIYELCVLRPNHVCVCENMVKTRFKKVSYLHWGSSKSIFGMFIWSQYKHSYTFFYKKIIFISIYFS